MRAGKKKPDPDADLDTYRCAARFCRDRAYAVDGGAHLGTWTRWMAADFASVLAFEPQPHVWTKLVEAVDGWDEIEHKDVHTINAALGERAGRCVMANDLKRSTSTAAFAVFTESGAVCAGPAVEVVALDQYELPALDLLKLDLEGGELFALRGGRRIIGRCRPVVVLEESKLAARHYRVPATAAVDWLLALGYKVASRAGVNVVLVP